MTLVHVLGIFGSNVLCIICVFLATCLNFLYFEWWLVFFFSVFGLFDELNVLCMFV